MRFLRQPRYIILAIASATAIFAGLAWIPLLPLIVQVLEHPRISILESFSLITTFFVGSFTDMSAATLFLTLALATVAGINIATVVFLLRRNYALQSSASLYGSVTGFITAILGFGCAACGSLLLASLVGTSAGLAIQGLPFGEATISYSGLMLLVISTALLLRAAQKPLVC